MRRTTALWVLFVSACTLASFQVQAAVLSKLSRITLGQIGDKIKTVVSSNDFLLPTTMAFRSDSVYEAAANLLTIPVYAYNPALGIAASTVIGFAFDSKLDVKEAYDKQLLKGQQAISDIINNTFPLVGGPVDLAVVSNPVNTVWGIDGSNKVVLNGSWSGAQTYHDTVVNVANDLITGNMAIYTNSKGKDCYIGLGYINTYIRLIKVEPMNGDDPNYTSRFYYTGSLANTTNALDYPSQAPETLTYDQAATLAQNIANATASNPAVKNAINTIVKANPDIITNAPQITQQDIDNFITTNNYTTNQSYIDYLTNLAQQYPDDTNIKIALEQAKAEQAKQDAETYSKISDSAFEEPYNPGEHDIPARFTTFLNNVKSSGLFSFSSDFFDSLPGGGSPLLTIDGGVTFGSHTYDFSQAFHGGLTILKSVLLALFGFLSIRAVIMKR